MAVFNPAIDDYDDYDPGCPNCGSSTTFEDCPECGGEGYFDAYEDDPLWYEPGDTEPCGLCGGEGGWWRCVSSLEWCEAHPLAKREAAEAP